MKDANGIYIFPNEKHNLTIFAGEYQILKNNVWHKFKYLKYFETQNICSIFGFKSGTIIKGDDFQLNNILYKYNGDIFFEFSLKKYY